MMNRIPTKLRTITIDTSRPSDEATIKQINALKRGIKPNERIQVTEAGTTVTYSRYIEPRLQKLDRKLTNFRQDMKSAFAAVRDSLTTKGRGASDESAVASSNIKNSPPSKPNLTKTYSISIKKFNASVESQANQIPVLKGLQQSHMKRYLQVILENITSEKIGKSLISQFVSSNDAELTAFVKFVTAQKDGESMNDAVEIKQAINFAKQWISEANKAEIKNELNFYMSEKTSAALTFIATQLVNFDSGR